MEGLTGRDSAAIQVSGAEDKGAGPIGQTARAGANRGRLKYARVGAFGAFLADAGTGTLRAAGDTTKDQAEGSTEYVCGFAGGKENGLDRDKRESQGIEAELQWRSVLSGQILYNDVGQVDNLRPIGNRPATGP